MNKRNAPNTCLECGLGYEAGRKHETDFCCAECRKAFNNRRMQRGAELYDLFMNLRYNRAEANKFGTWALICKMAMIWREEDRRDRAGRDSFKRVRRLQDRLTRYAHVVLVRKR